MLGIGNNALPITKIGFYTSDYENLPFTKGLIQFKATFLHGWLGEKETYIKNAYLHEKSLFIKAGANLPVDITVGLQHFAQWGGIDPVTHKSLPRDLKAYWHVFSAKFRSSVKDSLLNNEYYNRVGNHLGTWNFGLNYKRTDYTLSAFYSIPFEDESGFEFLSNRDFLAGIQLKLHPESIISEVSFEVLSTTWQSGPGFPDSISGFENHGYSYGGRDNYYNNYLYMQGWTYKDRVISNPLFITKQKAILWGLQLSQYDADNVIINNRVRSFHVGIKGNLRNNFQYRLLATFTKNYGTYSALYASGWNGIFANPDFDYTFNPPLKQNYFLFEINKHIKNKWNFLLSAGLDTGEMTNNFGMMIGAMYNILIVKSNADHSAN